MQSVKIVSVEPTVFFVRDGKSEGGVLRQLVRLGVQCDAGVTGAELSVDAPDQNERGGESQPLPRLAERAGASLLDVYIPDIRTPGPVTFRLQVAGAVVDEKTVDWRPTRHWEVHSMHFSHHDLGYTDLPADLLQEHAAILDDVVRYCDETAGWPDEDSKFRFVAEQAWSLSSFVERRPPEAVQRLVAAIKRGQIEVTALFANEVTELCGSEELIRLLYPSFDLKRRYGIVDIAVAEHNDIPGFSWGLANVLAGAGIRYFSPGIPRWYHHTVHQLWDEEAVLNMSMPGAFWWQAIDGARVLVWFKSHGPEEWLPTGYENALRELPEMLAKLDRQGYAYDMVSYMTRGGWRDNGPALPLFAYLARQWNERWAYPHLVISTYGRFLQRFEQRYGSTLKTVRGEAPGTDYPVAATCTPQEMALNRQAHDWLLSGEKWATLASRLTDYPYPAATLRDAYRSTIWFDEHCWGMADPGGPAHDACANEKTAFAHRAAALSHDLKIKSTNRIADAITYPQDAWYLTVFNPFSWQRTDVVRAPVHEWSPRSTPMHWQAPTRPGDGPIQMAGGAVGRHIVEPPVALLEHPFKLIDESTGESMPYQINRTTDPMAARPWAPERVAMSKVDPRYQPELVFVGTDLPPVGYKTYRIEPCDEWPARDAAGDDTATPQSVDSRFFRLDLDATTGVVTALIDKAQRRDVLDHAAPHGLADVVARFSETGEPQTATFAGPRVVESGPLYATLRMKGSAPGCPSLTREITLYHTLKRVDVGLRVLRDSTPNLELYCAFPFQVDGPRVRFESAATVMEPLRDQMPGSNTDYYGVQHWADVRNDECGVTWTSVDAPMAEFGGLWPGYVSFAHHGVTPRGYGHPFLKQGELTKGYIYSLLMYHNFRTNFINVHTGETVFRYSFTTHGPAQVDGAEQAFGWGVAEPPQAIWMKGERAGAQADTRAGSLPAATSFCQVDTPNVMLLAWKRAEDGSGFVLRLIETAGRESDVTITLPHLNILHAYQANLVEENQSMLPAGAHTICLHVGAHSIATIRVVEH